MKTDNTGFTEFIPLTGKKNNMEMSSYEISLAASQVEKGWALPGCAAELEVVMPNPQGPAIPRLLWPLHIL